MRESDCLELINLCFSSLDGKEELQGFVEHLARGLGAAAGGIGRNNAAENEIRTYGSVGIDPAYRDIYDIEYFGENPWIAALMFGPHVRVCVDIEARPGFRGSPYFNEWMRLQGLAQSFGARLGGTDRLITWIGFARGPSQPAFGDESNLIDRLMPHLRRVVSLSDRRRDPLASSERLIGVDGPAFLIGPDERIVEANDEAETLFKRDLFRVRRDGRLAARHPADRDAVRGAIRFALGILDPNGGAGDRRGDEHPDICLIHDEAGRAFGLQVRPLRVCDLHSGAMRTMALVRVSRDGPDAGLPDLRLFALEYDLTATETELVAALTAGLTLADFAAQKDIKLSTARWHLKNAENKTGTKRAEQLVALAFRKSAALT